MDALSSTSAPYLLLWALALALGLALVLWLALRHSRREGGLREVAEDPSTTVVDFSGESSDAEIRATFSRGLELLARLAPGRNGRYQLPWYVMIGGTPQENAEILASLRIPLPFGAPPGPAGPVSWWIFDRAVVIEASGAASAVDAEGAPAPGAWMELLRCLRTTRPARPIDGLVVAIPASDLEGVEPSSAAVQTRSTLLATRAAQLVERLGFRLPVHVAITGTETLSGFLPTVSTIDPEERGQMLAWANAQGLSSAYSSAWVSEAIATLARGFARYQLETFAEATLPDDVRQVYLFPQQVAALEPALSAYLNRIFLPSSDAEPSFLRSIGLCGKASADPAASADTPETLANFGWARGDASSGSSTSAEVSFVEDLFGAKVFPERALARPAGSTEQRRLKLGHVLRAATVVAALAAIVGLLYGPYQVGKRTGVLDPWLERASSRLHADPDAGDALDSDRILLSDLGAIRSFEVQTWMLPASWGTGVDRDVRGAISTTHVGIFLPDVRKGLLDRRTALARGAVPRPAPKQQGAGAVESTGEFLDLAGFARRLSELEAQARRYDTFAGGRGLPGRRLRDFEQLARFALGVTFAPPTSSAKTSNALALSTVALPADQAIAMVARPEMTARANAWVEALFRKIFTASWVQLGANDLAASIDAFGRTQSAGEKAFLEMRRLLAKIQAFEQTLARPDQQWLAAATFSPGAAYDATVASLSQSAWLGSTFGPSMNARGNRGFRQMQNDLIAVESVFVGPILATADGRPKLALAPEAAMLEPAIQGLLNEPFVPQDPAQIWQMNLPPGQRLTWDTQRLSDTALLGAAFDSFLAKGLQVFPQSLRRTAAEAARNRLSLDVSNNLAAAQIFTPAPPPAGQTPLELAVQQDVANFSTSSTYLGQILAYGQRLNLSYGVRPLANLMGQQGVFILREVERLMIASRLYLPQPRSLEQWSGDAPPSPDAFGVSSASALTTYLGSQRSRASQIANVYAQPVLAGLQPATAYVPSIALHPVVGEWNAILAALKAAGQQTAGGSVADLEGFISGPMAQMTGATCKSYFYAPPTSSNPTSCAQVAPSEPVDPPAGRDFFRRRERELWATLGDRCDQLVAQNARSGYCALRASFDKELARQFPFAEHDPLTNGAEAQPAAIARFYQVYDQKQPLVVQAPTGTFGPQQREIDDFLERMCEARPLFATYLAKPSQAPMLDFNVVFRVNRNREIEGRQIFNWSLRSGDQTIATTNPGSTATAPPSAGSPASSADTTVGRWTYGQPVAVAFTWAQNSPWQPATRGLEPNASSDGTVVTYSYANAWSLLSLLRNQEGQAADFPGLTDPDPQTLRFLIKTVPDAPPTPPLPDDVRVYVRVALQSSDQKQRLVMPTSWWTTAAPAYVCRQNP